MAEKFGCKQARWVSSSMLKDASSAQSPLLLYKAFTQLGQSPTYLAVCEIQKAAGEMLLCTQLLETGEQAGGAFTD